MSTTIPGGAVVQLRELPKTSRLFTLFTLAGVMAMAACSQTDLLIVDESVDAEFVEIEVVSGDGQAALVGGTAPALLVVHAYDENGNSVADLPIEWSFSQGRGQTAGGSTSADTVRMTTDANGLAEVSWELGTRSGIQRASAWLALEPDTASAPAPVDGPAAAPGGGRGAPKEKKCRGRCKVEFTADGTPGPVASVAVSPTGATLLTGGSIALVAQATDQYGNALSGTFDWQSDDVAVASVDGSGTVTGLAVGSADVRATFDTVQGSAAVEVNAVVPSVTITTGSLPDGLEGAAYSQSLSASGGDGSFSWSLDSGSLPSGMSLSSGGVISGTPSATGLSSFTVRVASAGQVATRGLSISVSSVPNPAQYRQHMPANWTVISDYGMDDEPPATDQYYEGQPMGDWLAQFWATPGGNMRRMSDPTAPLSPGYVLEEIYPEGLSGNGTTSWYRDIPNGDKVYISWVVKWDADFHHNGTSEKQIHFNLGRGHENGEYFLFQFHWGAESMYNIYPADPYYSGANSLYANLEPNGLTNGGLPRTPPENGVWIEYEFLFDRTTGTVRWWKNGVPHAHHTGRTFGRIGMITFDTTWGGGGNKQGIHSRYTDHVTIAVGN